MRLICLIVLAGLAGACSDSGKDDSSRLGPELANATDAASPGDTALLPAAVGAEGGGSPSDSANISSPPADLPISGERVASLPLQLGFYVSTDVSCGQASNATLQLLRRDGINTSRTPCDFDRIEKVGDASYRVTETCTDGGEAWGRTEERMTSTAIYQIESNTRFKVVGDSWESSMQYCPQPSLPEPWRDNDIADIVG